MSIDGAGPDAKDRAGVPEGTEACHRSERGTAPMPWVRAPAIADEDKTHLLPDRATGLPILRPHPARSALKKMRDVGLFPNLQQQAGAGQ
jgi:hypothetical protein